MAESFGWPVNYVPQTHDLTCWAACTAMMVNTRDGSSYTDDDICRQVGVDPDASDASASDDEWISQYLPHFNLRHVAGSCMLPEGWVQLLQDGPTIVGVYRHVVVASGYQSDDTEEGTYIYVHDPADGEGWWSFEEIDQKFMVRANRDIHLIQY